MMRAVVLWWQRALCTLRPIQTAIVLVLLSRPFLLQLRLPERVHADGFVHPLEYK